MHSSPGTNLHCTPFKRWLTALANTRERARTRHLLAQMDERQLSDLSLIHI